METQDLTLTLRLMLSIQSLESQITHQSLFTDSTTDAVIGSGGDAGSIGDGGDGGGINIDGSRGSGKTPGVGGESPNPGTLELNGVFGSLLGSKTATSQLMLVTPLQQEVLVDGQFLAPRVLIGLTLESPHVPTTPQIKLGFLMTADKRLLTASKSLEDSKQVTQSVTPVVLESMMVEMEEVVPLVEMVV